jgi:hypothetical protein
MVKFLMLHYVNNVFFDSQIETMVLMACLVKLLTFSFKHMEESLDPTKELSSWCLSENLRRLFHKALQISFNSFQMTQYLHAICGPLWEIFYQNLHAQMFITSLGRETSSIRLVLHLVNSILTTRK